METDSKFDVDEGATASDKKAKIVNQKERQSNALMLSRQGTTSHTSNLRERIGAHRRLCFSHPRSHRTIRAHATKRNVSSTSSSC